MILRALALIGAIAIGLLSALVTGMWWIGRDVRPPLDELAHPWGV